MAMLMFTYSIVPAALICGTNINLGFILIRLLGRTIEEEALKRSKRMYLLGGYCSIAIYMLLWVNKKVGGVLMVEKIAGAMHVFAIIYLLAGLVAVFALLVAAIQSKSSAVSAIKSLFSHCFLFALILWIITWLIS